MRVGETTINGQFPLEQPRALCNMAIRVAGHVGVRNLYVHRLYVCERPGTKGRRANSYNCCLVLRRLARWMPVTTLLRKKNGPTVLNFLCVSNKPHFEMGVVAFLSRQPKSMPA